MADTELKNNRDIQLDALKGFAIILVVIGHITAFTRPDSLNGSVLFQLIYSFHMPLLFFVSGYLVFGRFGPSTLPWLKKKFMQLIVPYIVFTLFYFSLFSAAFYKISFIKLGQMLFSYTIPDSAWFLPVLFESFLILALLINAEKFYGKISYVLFFLIVGLLLPVTGITSIPLVSQIVVNTPFVIAGYLVCMFKGCIAQENIKYLGISGSIFFPLLFLFKLSPFFLSIDFGLFHLYFTYTIAFAGIILSWSVVKLIVKHNVSFVFVMCGIFSLEIYLTHLIILNGFSAKHWPLWLSSGGVAIVSGSIALLLLSLVATILISYNEKISKLVFGRWSFKFFKTYLDEINSNK